MIDRVEPDRVQVRLAELVAALSLGIDLGFGQPMEHVLRQCLIALRLAERSIHGRCSPFRFSRPLTARCSSSAREPTTFRCPHVHG
jgi:hypothetical protein